MSKPFLFVTVLLVVSFVFAACTPTASAPTANPAQATPVPPMATVTPAATAVPTVPPAPTEPPTPIASPTPSGLSPEPRAIKIQTTDGKATLDALFYPAAAKNAPIIVFNHWANGDQFDWVEIAYWLQNRGLGGQSANPKKIPWLDASWFPVVPKDQSLNVLTFTYRGCDTNGCRTFDPQGWWIDANSAMKTAATLEGVDPKRILAAGASIGADGAADSCFWLNGVGGGTCLGAFSLSPGSYLTVKYADAVKELQAGSSPRPTWCLFAEGDSEASPACKSAEGEAYRAISFPGNSHGMNLINPKIEPKTLDLLLDWITTSLSSK